MALFREFDTSSGKKVFVGRNAENNEELVKQISQNEYVFHTARPGSPFVNIKSPSSEVSKEDIKETAVFCAKYSQDWRDNKKDIIVHLFLGKDIYKEKGMKSGTFGVKNIKEIKVRKEDILEFEKSLGI
jgi:predicted ribosome quality control (RQC) complex YloA/Tae2 family protein